MKKYNLVMIIGVISIIALASVSCEAATDSLNTNMPWTSGTTKLMAEITGPIPKLLAVVGGAMSGIMLGLGLESSFTKKAIQLVLGMSIAIGAASFVTVVTGTSVTVSGLLF